MIGVARLSCEGEIRRKADGSGRKTTQLLGFVSRVVLRSSFLPPQAHFALEPGLAATFFCGGSRNADRFIDLFDEVFVLEIDLDTLNRRLAARPEDAWRGPASEGEAFARLQHATKEGLPTNAIIIDATAPLSSIVDTIAAQSVRAPA
jgi:hypothetical protein